MILALLLMVAMPMMAERVSPETARKVATTFLNNNGAKSAQLTDLSKAAGFANLYIFNGEEGFVVMAADDCVQPILGYSLTGKFVAENLPTNVSGWLQGYNDEIQYVIDSKMKATAETAKLWKELTKGNSKVAKAAVVVTPLIQTKWNQNKYYNSLCPAVSDGPDGHAYVGCVATAMAQVMKFHEYPSKGNGSHSYTWQEQTLGANFGTTTYDWANMNDYYEYYYDDNGAIHRLSDPSSAEIQAIATLMYHCGVSVNMNYGGNSTGGSAAATAYVANALKNYFNYSSTAQYKQKSGFTDADWIAMVKAELDAYRPLEYAGQDPNGSSGHAFVCDGYDDRDYFHFNWGWSGNYDGYFSLNNLNTGANNQSGQGNGVYTRDQSAVFGIQPNYNNQYAPSNLVATLVQASGVRNVNLSWSAATNANSYKVYRNNMIIGTVSSTTLSFTDAHIPYGSFTYFIRSVDANGNLSQASNSEDITLEFPAPSNLSAQFNGNSVALTWDGSAQASSYNLYCNEALIANVNTTSYTHANPAFGDLTYFVKGVDDLGDESEASNTVTLTHAYGGPVVNDLTARLSGNNIQVSWTPLTGESATLRYATIQGSYYIGGYTETSNYWAVRFPASLLVDYAGMALVSISNYIAKAGNYYLYAYQCTTNIPTGETIISNSGPYNLSTGNKTISFDPVYLDPTKDLWVVFKTTDIDGPITMVSTSTEEGNYYSYNGTSWNQWEGRTWPIAAGITDGTYTYNLYRNGEAIATAMSGTTYTDPNRNNAANYYTVTTNYFGRESAASNGVGLTLGTASLSSLELGENDQMTITEGSKLTVSGTLSDVNANSLILENGAQLVNGSNGVLATVKKTVTAYTQEGGWNLIASPIADGITPSSDNGLLTNSYDLYTFDQSQDLEWRNYEAEAFSIENKTGYLYANSGDLTTISFAGALANTATPTTLAYDGNATWEGFNLIGNPYPCNAYIDRSFYVLNTDGSDFTLGSNPITPCSAILVQAQNSDDNSVTFSKEALDKKVSIVAKLTTMDAKGERVIDQARVCFDEADQLSKFTMGQGTARIYIPQGNHNYAVACANGENEMPLNFKAVKNGTYTLAFEVENLDLDYLHLIDNMTGEEVDVLAMPTYTFEAKTSDYASRFHLVFAENETEGASTGSAAFAYITDGEIIINVADACNASLQVVDMMGRVVLAGDAMNRVSTNGMTAGVYVLRLINGEQVKTQKMIIE